MLNTPDREFNLCQNLKGYSSDSTVGLFCERKCQDVHLWYRAAMETAEEREIAPNTTIRVVTPPYFCATKLEAFEGRSGGDYLASHDLEDIIAVIDGRAEIVGEIERAAGDVRSYIAGKLKGRLKNNQFIDALPGRLGSSEGTRGRTQVTLNRMKQIASFD